MKLNYYLKHQDTIELIRSYLGIPAFWCCHYLVNDNKSLYFMILELLA